LSFRCSLHACPTDLTHGDAGLWIAGAGVTIVGCMGELQGLAAQILIFFLFTPACLIARYGGRALDRRAARGECRAAMRAYGIDAVEWHEAGRIEIQDGELRMPDLPDAPGLRRLEFVGPHPRYRSITITGSMNLHRLTVEPRPGRQFADDDMRAHVKIGGTINVSYIDFVASRRGALDLADRLNRRRVVDLMRQQAELEVA
jgi:hypothetical protein